MRITSLFLSQTKDIPVNSLGSAYRQENGEELPVEPQEEGDSDVFEQQKVERMRSAFFRPQRGHSMGPSLSSIFESFSKSQPHSRHWYS